MGRPLVWLLWFASLLASLALLASCGGSGGSADTQLPVPPVVEVVGPGELKSVTLVNTVSAADIATALPSSVVRQMTPVPQYAVTSYKLTYLTKDGHGNEVLASGLVSVPVKTAGSLSPVISYQHGTILQDALAPSNNVVASEPSLIMASLGYIVVATDYVGYGASKGVEHPYLLSAPTASAVIDMLTAAKTWRQKNAVSDNGQLFLVGYSEGGYATMAAHRALQANGGSQLAQLLVSVPGAGPYHVGETLDAILAQVRSQYPILGSLISPGLLRNLGGTVRDEVRRQIMSRLISGNADVSFQSDFLDNYLADDTTTMDRVSNVHDWKPMLPVRMYHGRDDLTVTYVAATRTLQTMQANGSTMASLTDCPATPAGHLECVSPYFSFMLAQLTPVVKDL